MATPTNPQPPCPQQRTWDEIASGLVQGDEALAALEHASFCPECTQALKSSIEIFALEEQAPPKAVPIEGPRRRALSARWLAIAALLIVAVGLGFLYRQRARRGDSLGLLAQAYTLHRTLDLRLPGAAYGRMRVERGAEAQRPTQAVEAELDFRRALERDSNDPIALHAKGRWEILYGSPDDAIQALQAARDWGPAKPDADLLTELAIAYGEKGRRNGQAADRVHAIEFLGQALQIDPTNPAALYNRAIIQDELNMPGPAIVDLERLITQEPSGDWSNEARKKLTEVRNRHSRFFHRGLGDEEFDEVALDLALCDLHAVGVSRVAGQFRSQHGDRWLSDLLALPDTPPARRAEEILGRMAQIRLTFESGRYVQEKAAFDDLYKSELPPALKAWRDFESLYRATHARGEFRCPQSASRGPSLQYRWLEVQIFREQGFCSFQSGDMDAAEDWAKQSIALADASDFPVSAIRSAGLVANIEWRRGMYRRTLALANTNLHRVFDQHLPVARSQEFYNMMMSSAEDLGWWHAARTAAAAMTEAAEAAGFHDLEFTSIIRWAQLSLRCGDREQARSLFQNAAAKFARSVLRPVSRAWAEIGFAEATRDESKLWPFESELEQSPDPLIWIPYQRVRAELELAADRLPEAHARISRVLNWMNSPEYSHPQRSHQWRSECRQAAQVSLRLFLREGRTGEAFQILQQWKKADQAARAKFVPVSHEDAIAFAVAGVGDRIGVWRSDGATLDFQWAKDSKIQVERLVRRLTRALASPDSSLTEVSGLAKQTGEVLFGSWLAEIAPNRPVIFQTDESIEDLALSVLPGAGECLGLEHPVSITPLELPTRRVRQSAHSTATGLLLIDASAGNSLWAADLPPLKSAAREIESIRIVAPPPVSVLTAGSLTVASIGQHLSNTRVMHFAGHAIGTASGVGLVLPDAPGPVLLQDLICCGLRAPPTVVLSACSTGKRTVEDSAGSNSLAAAFLLEGSSEVIASLWNVDSEAAAQFMTEFHRQLGILGDSGQAFQAATGALARSSRFSHPYYWATFARFIRA